MKRHLNALLQRKHTEFEGARDSLGSSRFDEFNATAVIQPEDGYDWLIMIKSGAQATRAPARS